MNTTTFRKVVTVPPFTPEGLTLHVEGDGTQILGHCRHDVLECGHIRHANPTMSVKVGALVRCYTCEKAK